ncbi:hypothetical protein KA005_07470 [bacterium]|nr:hypothetical protein [bacterium]
MIILRDKQLQARKNHTCDLCNGIIKKGELYNCQTNVYDGQIYNFKSHIHCSELAHEYDMYQDTFEDGLSQLDFAEYISELTHEGKTTAEKALNLWRRP